MSSSYQRPDEGDDSDDRKYPPNASTNGEAGWYGISLVFELL